MEKIFTRLFKFLLLTVFVFSSQIIIPQTKVEKIESLLNEYYKFKVFNGSILVAEGGKVIYKNGFGFANMARLQNSLQQCLLCSLLKKEN